MNAPTRRLLGGLATAAVLLLGQARFVHGASPSPLPPSGPTGAEMLSVQPSLISIEAKPGTTSLVKLTLRSAAAFDIKISSRGLAQGVDGSFASVPAEQDTSQYSARAMLTATPASLQVRPGDIHTIDVAIAVPADVGDGSRYAILTITGMPGAAPVGSANVGFGVELGVSAIVKITDTPQTRTGEIRNISVEPALPGQALPIKVEFANTGNSHYGALPNELVTTAVLQDSAGTQLATAGANGNQLSLIPSFVRDIALSMTPSQSMVDNAKYHLEVGVGLKDGTILDRKALDFTWFGGGVLGATSAPVQPPAGAGPTTDVPLIIAAALFGAAVVVLIFVILQRIRRRPAGGQGTAGQGTAGQGAAGA